jgi:hypothetical protein
VDKSGGDGRVWQFSDDGGSNMSAIIYTLAQYRAVKQVKEDIRRRYGSSKLREYSLAQIKTMAQMWIEMHRDELIADAKEMISKSPELTKMYEKEQRQLRANVTSDAQNQNARGSGTSCLQISGAK